ncbi:cellobiose dehydrogenase [Grosmannia clavigera kw1407]|uniref:Cellobiose dehydrogenase n=1 Tax=Grosmannia clavigera (strain kw1407 / UAMH 11150) TaxID=655863 RepID=F0XIN8_GROCL|nr:cellobiose dehydrogenase [Grosmannia clavigera kw1407]EFX02560.1 cellobiose dehydrogenase [Grosmannia clavigera kw1407]
MVLDDNDIIVVGGGPGGIVSATKFAEAGLNTLLLEHGGPMLWRDGNREVPAWTQKEYPNNTLTRHDGMVYYLAPSDVNYYCLNLPTGQRAACQLGGGTSVNAMQQWWPPRAYLENTFDFDGWTVADFDAAIHRTVKRIPHTPYWSTDNKFYQDEVYGLMSNVLSSIGLNEVNNTVDVDNKYNTFGRDMFAQAGGQRGGPSVGYLQDAKRHPNFTLKLYSPVTRVVRTGSQITGVYVNGTIIKAKNVVLSAGVWNTPALLFASGIGPVSELITAAAIGYTPYEQNEWIINNAVGANLHDNPTGLVSFTYNDTKALPYYNITGFYDGSNYIKADADLLFSQRAGPLTIVPRILCGWIKVAYPLDTSKYMNIQVICSSPNVEDGSFQCQFNLNEGALSRGRITLNTTGTLSFADGAGPWLTDPNGLDVELYAQALERFVNGSSKYPGLTVTDPVPGTIQSYREWLGEHANKTNNLGTSDGTKYNNGSCADINAKVYGTDNLFVIDGSLSPAPTTSNPTFLYEAMAELASERIINLLTVNS